MKTWYIVKTEYNYLVAVQKEEVKDRETYGCFRAKDLYEAVQYKNRLIKGVIKCLRSSEKEKN